MMFPGARLNSLWTQCTVRAFLLIPPCVEAVLEPWCPEMRKAHESRRATFQKTSKQNAHALIPLQLLKYTNKRIANTTTMVIFTVGTQWSKLLNSTRSWTVYEKIEIHLFNLKTAMSDRHRIVWINEQWKSIEKRKHITESSKKESAIWVIQNR